MGNALHATLCETLATFAMLTASNDKMELQSRSVELSID
jgi:hypothetical protein